jgi:hypothetical protein
MKDMAQWLLPRSRVVIVVPCSEAVVHSVLLFCQLAIRNSGQDDVHVDVASIAVGS